LAGFWLAMLMPTSGERLRQHQPPMLVVWGKWDSSFADGGALAYQRDVPKAEVHILDAGHFALDEKVDEIAALMRAFLAKQDPGNPHEKQST